MELNNFHPPNSSDDLCLLFCICPSSMRHTFKSGLLLAGCSQLTSSGLSNLLQLRQLEELELTNCPGSSPELVSYLRQGIEHGTY